VRGSNVAFLCELVHRSSGTKVAEGRGSAALTEPNIKGNLNSAIKMAEKRAQMDATLRVAALSDHLVVLNQKAVPILKDGYGVPENKIHVIHHGVPEAPFVDPNYYKDKFAAEDKLVILTFGFLSRNKGIEMMLEALPEVVRAHPEVIYIVLGETHPEVKRTDGEAYRLWLQKRVKELGLSKHVIFDPRYLEQAELLEYIGACDIYVTPYHSKEQIVSGTLAYAVGIALRNLPR